MGPHQKHHQESVLEYRGYFIRIYAGLSELADGGASWLVSADIVDPANPTLPIYAYDAKPPQDLVADRYTAVRERIIGMEYVIDLGNLPPLQGI